MNAHGADQGREWKSCECSLSAVAITRLPSPVTTSYDRTDSWNNPTCSTKKTIQSYRVSFLLSHILKFNNLRLGGPMFLKFCTNFGTVLGFFMLKFRTNPSTRSRDMCVCLTCISFFKKKFHFQFRLLTVLSKRENAFFHACQANGHISGTRWRIRTKL